MLNNHGTNGTTTQFLNTYWIQVTIITQNTVWYCEQNQRKWLKIGLDGRIMYSRSYSNSPSQIQTLCSVGSRPNTYFSMVLAHHRILRIETAEKYIVLLLIYWAESCFWLLFHTLLFSITPRTISSCRPFISDH